MFKRKRWHRIMAVLLCITMLFSSVPAMALTESSSSAGELPDTDMTEKAEENLSLEETLVIEDGVSEENAVMDESTADSTTFHLGGGKKMIIFHSQDVRYEDDTGELRDYDPSLVKLDSDEETADGDSLDGYKFENRSGDIKHYLPKKLDIQTPVVTENGRYSISMAPIDTSVADCEAVRVSEEILTPYEQIEEKKTTAVYGNEDTGCRYEYTSLSQGIKETVILEERPESNVFRFEIRTEGMTAELDETQNVILLNDLTTDKTVATIDRPFMNDASGEAYSEDLVYALEKTGKEEYLLTLTVSEAYLSDEERMYPVTIDPTATWKGNEDFLDVYVISGSTYGDINFYDSDIRLMASGKGSYGTYRTYIKLPGIKSTLEDKYVDSAYLTVYESGDCDAGQTITINRAYSSWTASTLTWNNKPSYYAAVVNRFTTKGTQYKAHKISVRTMIRNMLNDTNNSNYGIVLRNTTDSPGYAEFYGSRTTLSSYRPKLVVTYYDKPTVPESLSLARYTGNEPLTGTDYLTTQYMKKGHRGYATWTGLVSHNLADVEYRVLAGDDSTPAPTSITSAGINLTAYRSSGKSSASGKNVYLPYLGNLPEGKYKLYLRGTDAAGMHGTAKYKVFHVDGTPPTLTASVSPSGTTSSNPSNNAMPTVSFTASDDKSLHYVSIAVDDKPAVKVTGNSYTLKKSDLKTDGKHIITVTAHDTAGNTVSKTLNYYFVNTGSSVPSKDRKSVV